MTAAAGSSSRHTAEARLTGEMLGVHRRTLLRNVDADELFEDFLISAASTIASLTFAKLERGDLAEAKKGIDALASLVPHLGGDFARDLSATLANLQVAYATAAS